MPTPYRKEIIALKMVDILLLSVYYFIIGFFIATGTDYIFGKFDSQDDEKKSTLRLFFEAVLYTFILMIIFYIVRNIVERIPFPFEGVYGFRHELVKERGGDVVFVFILFFYQNYYVDKLKYLHQRLLSVAKGME
jgi:hypothetical protein